MNTGFLGRWTVATLIGLSLTGCRGSGGASTFSLTGPPASERFDLARLHERDGQYARARDFYLELHRRDRKDPKVCQRLAIVNTKLGDQEEATKFFELATALAPNDAVILTDHGYALCARGEYSQAEAVLQRAVALDSRNQRAVNNLALAVAFQGRMDEAFQHFRRFNDEASAHANIAYVHAQLGNGQQAIDRYSRSLELNPDLESSRQGLLSLARLEQQHRQAVESGEFVRRDPEAESPDAKADVELASHSDDRQTVTIEPAGTARENRPTPTAAPIELEEVKRSVEAIARAEQPITAPRAEVAPARTIKAAAAESAPDEFEWADLEVPSNRPEVAQADIVVQPQPAPAPDTAKKIERSTPAPAVVRHEVRWQQLTVTFAKYGGKKNAFDVLEKALLALAREESFDDVIAEFSDSPDPVAGGYVDWTNLENVDGELRGTLEDLPEGELSRVISGNSSYRIVRVVGRRTPNKDGWVASTGNFGATH